MRAIIVMYDTLNRKFLPPYGCDWTKAPNFSRLAERAVTFDKAYAGSLPTMPTRREMHTGRHNFLHRRWGQLEPFDDSMPQKLRESGVWTHLTSDGYHYWEDGGATYHNRYSSWEFFRGQEGDRWRADLAVEGNPFDAEKSFSHWQDWINRKYMPRQEDWPQHRTFTSGLEFLKRNRAADNWLLQIETFDPHQPFFAPRKYKDLYDHEYPDPPMDWPATGKDLHSPEDIKHIRFEYAALLSMCDDYLGRVLDAMDELDLWKDTLLIVNTDHGFMLGEHGWVGKGIMPFYEEISHLPLFIWDPRSGHRGQRSPCLVQNIDLAPTLLEYFGIEAPADTQGKSLKEAIAGGEPVREAALFGSHGAHVYVTDGRYVYMRAPESSENKPLYNYTLTTTWMNKMLPVEDLSGAELAGPLPFTKNCPVLKIPASSHVRAHDFGSRLFDVEADPAQDSTVSDPTVEKRMIGHMVRLMKENDAPPEQFQRLGLEKFV